MKIFIAFLLIFSSLSYGKGLGDTTTTTGGPTTTSGPTTTTGPTITASTTVAPSTTSTSNTQSTTTLSSTTPPATTTTASPTADVGVNVTWIFSSSTNVTNVIMVITNLDRLEWAAIGLGQNQAMVNITE